MNLSEIGTIAESCLAVIPTHLPDVDGAHVVVTNHIHMINGRAHFDAQIMAFYCGNILRGNA